MAQSPRIQLQLAPTIQHTLHAVTRRKLAGTLLLFVVGHRPLALATGQLLLVLAPLLDLLGFDQTSAWAELLSDPGGPAELEAALYSQLVVASSQQQHR
jgi:hypothetical protein